jgi:hypothetical protein
MEYYLRDGIYPKWSTFFKTIAKNHKKNGSSLCQNAKSCSQGYRESLGCFFKLGLQLFKGQPNYGIRIPVIKSSLPA